MDEETGSVTVYLDRRFRHVGRIKKAAGTAHKKTITALNQMLDGLYSRGRLDILREIQKGRYTPLQVWAFYRTNDLDKLPTAATMSPLEEAFNKWIEDKECSDAHRRSLHQSLRHIMGVARTMPTIADLPELLDELRPKLKAAKHPRSFNLAKAAAQAFVKSTLKRNHPLYFAVAAVETLRVKPQRSKNPLTINDFWMLYVKLPQPAAFIAMAMAFTGMGWTEYQGKWEVLSDRIQIHGTKRTGRKRFVPRISWGTKYHEMPYKQFREELARCGNITPYDLRRTFANWMEEAGIPRTRRKMYLGHGASDVTDLYERHDIERFLVEDAERLKRLIDATETPTLKLEKKA